MAISLKKLLLKILQTKPYMATFSGVLDSTRSVAANSFEQLDLTRIIESSDNRELVSISDGKLVCNYNGMIQLSGSMYCNSMNGETGLYFYRKKGAADEEELCNVFGPSTSKSIAPKCVDAQESDLFYAKFRNRTSAAVTFYPGDKATYVSVVCVEYTN